MAMLNNQMVMGILDIVGISDVGYMICPADYIHGIPSGKLSQNYGESPCYQWVNPRTKSLWLVVSSSTINHYKSLWLENHHFPADYIHGNCFKFKAPIFAASHQRSPLRTLSCAGADRLSSGMRGAFGKPYGTAARVDIGQAVVRGAGELLI